MIVNDKCYCDSCADPLIQEGTTVLQVLLELLPNKEIRHYCVKCMWKKLSPQTRYPGGAP
jgi:hypothetical protein